MFTDGEGALMEEGLKAQNMWTRDRQALPRLRVQTAGTHSEHECLVIWWPLFSVLLVLQWEHMNICEVRCFYLWGLPCFIGQQIWKTQQWPQDCKRSVFIPIPKKGNAKECSNYHTIALISHTSKVMLKFSKPGFNSTRTVNFQIFQLVLEKAEEPEIKLSRSAGSSKKQESSRKISISALSTMPKPLTVWMTTNCGKFLKRWEYKTTWPLEKSVCKSRSNS